MSVAFVPPQKGKPPPSPAQIQKVLDENAQFIQAILDYQNKGKPNECLQYQQVLHRNLMYLASIADAVSVLPPPPSQPHMHGPGQQMPPNVEQAPYQGHQNQGQSGNMNQGGMGQQGMNVPPPTPGSTIVSSGPNAPQPGVNMQMNMHVPPSSSPHPNYGPGTPNPAPQGPAPTQPPNQGMPPNMTAPPQGNVHPHHQQQAHPGQGSYQRPATQQSYGGPNNQSMPPNQPMSGGQPTSQISGASSNFNSGQQSQTVQSPGPQQYQQQGMYPSNQAQPPPQQPPHPQYTNSSSPQNNYPPPVEEVATKDSGDISLIPIS